MVATDTKEWKRTDYQVEHPNDWCPGCGDFGILSALQQAIAGLNLPPHEVAIFGGIGCSGKTQYYINAYSIHTLHGRLLPYATGAKLANPQLTVVAVGGDGDGLAIGAGHFVNSGRRNVDLAYILFNNEVYGLTKGQASPTLPLGLQTKSLPEPNLQGGVNALMLAMTSGFTWIGRAYAFDVRQMSDLIQAAISHPGLAFLDVLQPCPTYNDLHDKDWFAGDDLPNGESRVYDVNEAGHDPLISDGSSEISKLKQFIDFAYEWGDRIPTGVLLVNKSIPTYAGRIESQNSGYRHAPPAHKVIADEEGLAAVEPEKLFAPVSLDARKH